MSPCAPIDTEGMSALSTADANKHMEKQANNTHISLPKAVAF